MMFDELPAFCGEQSEIMPMLGKFLRESRQYGIFVICAAQDLLNSTLNNDNGAVRDNLLTNYYAGGDATTARLVLNLAKGEKLDESGLGAKGVTWLRAKGASIEKVKCRTPLADDLATTMLLGDMAPRQQITDIPLQGLRQQRHLLRLSRHLPPQMRQNRQKWRHSVPMRAKPM